MKPIKLDVLAVQKMASGHLCLNLSTHVRWEEFPDFAKTFLERCEGIVLDKAEAADIRMWKVRIRGAEYWLVFDDYPLCISLESLDDDGDRIIEELHKGV